MKRTHPQRGGATRAERGDPTCPSTGRRRVGRPIVALPSATTPSWGGPSTRGPHSVSFQQRKNTGGSNPHAVTRWPWPLAPPECRLLGPPQPPVRGEEGWLSRKRGICAGPFPKAVPGVRGAAEPAHSTSPSQGSSSVLLQGEWHHRRLRTGHLRRTSSQGRARGQGCSRTGALHLPLAGLKIGVATGQMAPTTAGNGASARRSFPRQGPRSELQQNLRTPPS